MSEWMTKTLGEVTENYDGRRVPIKSADRKRGPYPYYGASGVIDSVDDYIFDGEYLLVAEDGENLRTRTTPVAFTATGKFWVNNHAHVVRGGSLANTRYLGYLLSITDISGYLSGSTQPKLTQSAMNAIKLRLPSREHQDAVVEVLRALDDKIAANDHICGKYEAVLRLQFADLGLDSEPSTNAVSVSELMELNPPTPVSSAGDAVYLDMAALPTNSARVKSWHKRRPKSGARFKNGDTVMARITPCLENGKVAFVDFLADDEVGVGSTEFIVLRARPGLPIYLPYFLARSPRFQAYAIKNMSGSSGRQRVGAASLASFPLTNPKPGRLGRFGESAAAAFTHMKSIDAESRYLSDLRDSLLPGLMSGEVRVRDAEQAVEEAI